jgi:hypothetical protein
MPSHPGRFVTGRYNTGTSQSSSFGDYVVKEVHKSKYYE